MLHNIFVVFDRLPLCVTIDQLWTIFGKDEWRRNRGHDMPLPCPQPEILDEHYRTISCRL